MSDSIAEILGTVPLLSGLDKKQLGRMAQDFKERSVPAGTVSHTNWRWRAFTGQRCRLTMSIHWYVENSHLERADPPLDRIEVGHPGGEDLDGANDRPV